MVRRSIIGFLVLCLLATGACSPAPTASPPQTPRERIEALVRDILKGNNNRKVPNLKTLTLKELSGGKWQIAIETNASDNLSASYIRIGIETDMLALYKALYTSGESIATVAITAYFPLQDKYGRVSDKIVYESALIAGEAAKVNWANMTYTGIRAIWTAKIHASLR